MLVNSLETLSELLRRRGLLILIECFGIAYWGTQMGILWKQKWICNKEYYQFV